MALTKCPACNKEISEHAVTCPSCGHPLNTKVNTIEEFFRKYKIQIFFGFITVTGFIILPNSIDPAGVLSHLLPQTQWGYSIAYKLSHSARTMTLLGGVGFIISVFFIHKKK